ncbi:hypothetical protein [Streptomyces tubercidicus]|uniref:hypothetical protein n=1 Tax=Streptomyces tubercidicus TaxID=47759 RepID=UPI002E166364|nr:hypothetical protein OG761_24395 [Streptomyces tubercidicus]
MRTISTLRWVNGVGALIPARTATAPERVRSGGDLSLPIPLPDEESALVSAAVPAPASGTAPSAPAPHRTHPLRTPHGNGSAQATRRRTTTAALPAGRCPLPAHGESAGSAFPCADGDIARTKGVHSTVPAPVKGNCGIRGAGRPLRNGSVTMAAARVTGTRPAVYLAAEFSNKV